MAIIMVTIIYPKVRSNQHGCNDRHSSPEHFDAAKIPYMSVPACTGVENYAGVFVPAHTGVENYAGMSAPMRTGVYNYTGMPELARTGVENYTGMSVPVRTGHT